MREITALETQKRNPKRVNLFVDGKFVVGLDLESVVKERLEVGNEITDAEIKHLIEISGHQKILDKVFNFLSYRPRSQKEVRDYLVKRKVDTEEITDIVKYLSEKKYLNDEEFARWWAEQRTTFRPAGWRLLKMELRQKGVKEETIAKLLNYYIVEESQRELAQKVAEKKWKVLSKLSPEEAREKLTAALARRGFDWETIKEVVDHVLRG